MSSPEPANEAFFVDPDEPVEPAPEAQAAPDPVTTETPDTHESAAGAAAAMIDVPLGTLIFRAGLLGEEQLEDALREGMRTGKRLGEVLIARGWLEERDLGRLLAGQKGLPFVEIGADDAEPAALEMLSEEDAKLQVALPLRHEDGELVVAVADPSNELMLENLRRTFGAAPKLVVAPYAELVNAIDEAYARPRPEAPAEPEIVAVPDAPEPDTQPEPQAEAERAPEVRPMPIVLPPKEPVADSETPLPEAQPEPQAAEAEQKPVARPLPIVHLPKEAEAEPPPVAETAPAQPSPEPSAPAEDEPQVEAPVVYAIETTPAPQPPAPELPAQPAAEAVPDAPPKPQGPAAESPPAPELILELPPNWPSTGEDPAEEPTSPAPPPEAPAPEPTEQLDPASPAPAPEAPAPEAPAAEPPSQEEPASLTSVVLRLTDGTTLEVGTFPTVAEAAAEAQEVVIEIAAADRNGGWPYFAQRYLRPDLIISVDLLDEGSENDGLRRSKR